MRRPVLLCLLAVLATAGVATAAGNHIFPVRIALPSGFQPEGIAISGRTFYVGSIPTGTIYRGDLRTGRGAVLIPGKSGRQAIGLESDGRGRLFVAGGPTGDGYAYDVRTRADVGAWSFTAESETFVNDVVVTRGGAYFTDSSRPVLYRVPISANGAIATTPQELQLTGDYVHGGGFNVNGIDATRDGRTLIIVQSGTGKLFTVDPRTGVARTIALAGGATVTNGDGILLDGRTLYVVRNQLNRIAVIRLAPNLRSGRVLRELRSPSFSVPTTIDDHGRRLYAVNARFGTTPDRTTQYWLTQVRKPPGA
jgi:sugar lactone lactonase YvrE